MKVAIIDADLVGRTKHRFPNLACMKLSSYHKGQGDDVSLKQDYENLDVFDLVYISKVFTDTTVPDEVLSLSNVKIGGTGFYFDNAEPLPYEIEHSKPDYHLYDDFVKGKPHNEVKFYTDYSIGFITRGCFRKCGFCVNKKYDHVFSASPLSEWYDPERKKIFMIDDNFLGYKDWKKCLEELRATGKPFRFMQGMDERLLTPEKCELLFSSKYDGDMTFAFDKISDYRLIEKKLKLIREYSAKQVRFYVLCGFDDDGQWLDDFWIKDIESVFMRIELLGRYGALPYIMRFEKYKSAPEEYRGIYVTLARWVNQPSLFKKMSFVEYVGFDYSHGGKASTRYLETFKNKHPDVVEKWFHKRFFKLGVKNE